MSISIVDKISKPVFTALGVLFTLLGIIGAFLPVMPTTVFLIGALYCFTRSSPKLEQWLLNHPKYGATLSAWQKNGAISKRTKCIACCSMLLSFIAFCVFVNAPIYAHGGVALFMGIGAYFVITRPDSIKV
ncbi:YbaN family protein [Alteromonas sp. MB-3u-76]|uniref:YbaN family protein n=1 Tax=Alteromonas sp. MB-3u-76 TaxID=2058133 RepID=UPI0026CD64B9